MEPLNQNLIIAIIMGIGLSAACGFRVFIPMLIISIAARYGHIKLAENFIWLSSWPALITFLTASILEIATYYIPIVDNIMDNLSTPTAIIAGIILSSSIIIDISPLVKWTLAIIVGGGTAGGIQTLTALIRASSSVITAGIANCIISTIELFLSLILSVFAIFLPIIGLIIVFIFLLKTLHILFLS
ncbi:MAG TPA: DUF4126 domain-containing protein, partial [Victivallales bacterium]|nr:DUF4126 domain-containing protein [Victivallales bacterium]